MYYMYHVHCVYELLTSAISPPLNAFLGLSESFELGGYFAIPY